MGFSRQEYWSRSPFPSPGGLPDPGIKPVSLGSPALAGRFFTTVPPDIPYSSGWSVSLTTPCRSLALKWRSCLKLILYNCPNRQWAPQCKRFVSFLSVSPHGRTQTLAPMLPLMNLYQYVRAIKVMLATVEAFRVQWSHKKGVTKFTWWQVCQ